MDILLLVFVGSDENKGFAFLPNNVSINALCKWTSRNDWITKYVSLYSIIILIHKTMLEHLPSFQVGFSKTKNRSL